MYIYINIYRVEFKNNFLASSPIKRALRMCYSEPLYEEGKKQLNPTSNISISEEISSGLREILRSTIYNNEILYVISNSNHPPKIKQNIPDMIGNRISNLSSHDTKFNKTVKTYQDALHSSGYKQKLEFLKETPLANPKKKRQRRQKVIWFTPPFSNQVRGNIGRKFLQLLDSHFYPGHPLSKLFNRKTIKISYSTLPNIGQIISAHNRKILSNTTTTTEPERTCNCRQKTTARWTVTA